MICQWGVKSSVSVSWHNSVLYKGLWLNVQQFDAFEELLWVSNLATQHIAILFTTHTGLRLINYYHSRWNVKEFRHESFCIQPFFSRVCFYSCFIFIQMFSKTVRLTFVRPIILADILYGKVFYLKTRDITQIKNVAAIQS